jgi:uncharacterized protein YoxC
MRAVERRLDDVEDEISGLKQRFEGLRGQTLTLSRRLNRLNADLFDDDQDREDDTQEEFTELVQERRRRASGEG